MNEKHGASILLFMKTELHIWQRVNCHWSLLWQAKTTSSRVCHGSVTFPWSHWMLIFSLVLTGVGHEKVYWASTCEFLWSDSPFGKLNVLHRAAARTCLIFLWIHVGCRLSAGYVFVAILRNRFAKLIHVLFGSLMPGDWELSFIRWGAAGLVAFTVATILSVRPIRNMVFELFLISHIILIA